MLSSKKRNLVNLVFVVYVTTAIGYYQWNFNQTNTSKIVIKLEMKAFEEIYHQRKREYNKTYIPDEPGTLCETIHVALICMAECPQLVTPMLKSLLHHRQNPVHFHLIVDSVTGYKISCIFDSWNVPDVKYTTYSAQDSLPLIAWIPNKHYSGLYPLVKLLLPDILPPTLSRVILLDADMTVLCDVAELWAMFRNMTDEQFLGLVQESSFNLGFNTGVMLLDFKKLRSAPAMDWSQLWRESVIQIIPKRALKLADQDVINAIVQKLPKIVYNISCQYNVQMSTRTLSKHCYKEDVKKIKIIHWNSPKRQKIQLQDVEYFRSVHQIYVNFDANILREKLHRCVTIEATYD